MLLKYAWRNIWRNRRRTWVTLSSIVFGLSLMLVSLGLGDGAHQQVVNNGIGFGNGHLTIMPKGYFVAPSNNLMIEDSQDILKRLTEVNYPAPSSWGFLSFAGAQDVRWNPRIVLQAVASSATNSMGLMVVGLDLVAERPFHPLLRVTTLPDGWDRGLIVGYKVADRLGVKQGNKVVLMFQDPRGELASHLFRIIGTYTTGSDDIDSGFGFVSLPTLQRVLGVQDGTVTLLAGFFPSDWDNVARRDAVRAHLTDVPDVKVYGWHETLPELIDYVRLDDASAYFFYGILLIVIAFGILNTSLMSVLERHQEFGTLLAVGWKPRTLVALVLWESLWLAVVGSVFGLLLGLGGHAWFMTHGLDLRGIYAEGISIGGGMLDPILYSRLSMARIFWGYAVVVGIAVLAGVYPAWKAGRTDPIEAIREL